MPVPELQRTVARYERREWWRLFVSLAVILVLTAAIIALSVTSFRRGFTEQKDLERAVSSLVGMVLLFAVFAVYQQMMIVRLRRRTAEQIGMNATLELLRPPSDEVAAGRAYPRKFERYHLERRLGLIRGAGGRGAVIYGQTSDISEGGLGAALPEALTPGESVVLDIYVDEAERIVVRALVKHRKGFYHGFEFLDLNASGHTTIQRAVQGAPRIANTRPHQAQA